MTNNHNLDVKEPSNVKYNKNIMKNILENNNNLTAKQIGTDYNYKHEIVWPNVIAFLMLHILIGLPGAYLTFTGGAKFVTYVWGISVGILTGQGVLIGAHRCITHRAFKVKSWLKAVLLILHTMAGQNAMFTWCRDHRLHHRYSDTDADPHNSKRGFFFSHMGWLMMKKHPYVIELGRRIDMTDVSSDWMIMAQKKYYPLLYLLFAIFIPVWVPVYFFGEPWLNMFVTCYGFRYVFMLHATWLVNSAAHLYGTRPYDKNLQPVESWFVSWLTFGEGWHNYHHAFPWDYKAAELTTLFNISGRLIERFAKWGWVYDLKSATHEMVRNRILRAGDGTHNELGNDEARSAVTAVGFMHPWNPTYNVTYQPPSATVSDAGLPLFHETDIFSHKKISDEKKIT